MKSAECKIGSCHELVKRVYKGFAYEYCPWHACNTGKCPSTSVQGGDRSRCATCAKAEQEKQRALKAKRVRKRAETDETNLAAKRMRATCETDESNMAAKHANGLVYMQKLTPWSLSFLRCDVTTLADRSVFHHATATANFGLCANNQATTANG